MGDGPAIGQARDGRQVGVLVALERFQRRATRHIERDQGILVTIESS